MKTKRSFFLLWYNFSFLSNFCLDGISISREMIKYSVYLSYFNFHLKLHQFANITSKYIFFKNPTFVFQFWMYLLKMAACQRLGSLQALGQILHNRWLKSVPASWHCFFKENSTSLFWQYNIKHLVFKVGKNHCIIYRHVEFF